MRWQIKKPKEPEWGKTRIVQRFLFLPTTIEDETRWLEFSYITQELTLYADDWNHRYVWKNIRWGEVEDI
jgi:hypothetical protein